MKILWFVSSLEQKGGGERFVLEAVNALQQDGHDARIACDRLNADADFNGRYDISKVICSHRELNRDAGYISRVLNKLRGTFSLYRIIRRQKPEMVLCQSEFDAIRLYILSRILKFRYRVFVFGQMYQFKTDITRYSSVFRPFLEKIIASRPGYRETCIMPPPRLPFFVHFINEVISRFKYIALRQADHVFTVSNQVQWEVSLIYQRTATVCRAAFDEHYIDLEKLSAPRAVNGSIKLISVSRLVEKKRIDLMIAAFSEIKIPAQLSIIGAGPEERRLKKIARQSVRCQDIEFLGAVDDATLQHQISLADCLISLDIGDYDISVVEAMGKGLRVIVAADFDMTEFGTNFGGVVSISPDIPALVEAINNIPTMSSPSLGNLSVLKRLTWQSLARTCASDSPGNHSH